MTRYYDIMKLKPIKNLRTTCVDSTAMFDPSKLADRYTNLVPIERYIGHDYTYMVASKSGSELGTVALGREANYCVDNYPAPRKFFGNRLPIRTFADFESDMERVGLPLSNTEVSHD